MTTGKNDASTSDKLSKKLSTAWASLETPVKPNHLGEQRSDTQQARLITALAINNDYKTFKDVIQKHTEHVQQSKASLTAYCLLKPEHRTVKNDLFETTTAKLSALAFNKDLLGPKGLATPMGKPHLVQTARIPTPENANAYAIPPKKFDYLLKPGTSTALPFSALLVKERPDKNKNSTGRASLLNDDSEYLTIPQRPSLPPKKKLQWNSQAPAKQDSDLDQDTNATEMNTCEDTIEKNEPGYASEQSLELEGHTITNIKTVQQTKSRPGMSKPFIITPVDGMDPEMVAKQQAKENKPKEILAIIARMRNLTKSNRMDFEEESNLPKPSDVNYENEVRRKELEERKRQQEEEKRKREADQEAWEAEKKKKRLDKKTKRLNQQQKGKRPLLRSVAVSQHSEAKEEKQEDYKQIPAYPKPTETYRSENVWGPPSIDNFDPRKRRRSGPHGGRDLPPGVFRPGLPEPVAVQHFTRPSQPSSQVRGNYQQSPFPNQRTGPPPVGVGPRERFHGAWNNNRPPRGHLYRPHGQGRRNMPPYPPRHGFGDPPLQMHPLPPPGFFAPHNAQRFPRGNSSVLPFGVLPLNCSSARPNSHFPNAQRFPHGNPNVPPFGVLPLNRSSARPNSHFPKAQRFPRGNPNVPPFNVLPLNCSSARPNSHFPNDQRRHMHNQFNWRPNPAQIPPPLEHQRKQELYSRIGHLMTSLNRADAKAIEDFLGNKSYMFGPGQTMRDFGLRKGKGHNLMIRLNKKDRSWKVVEIANFNH